jgi:hypothetical protein
MEQTEVVGIAVIKGVLGGEGPTAEALVMKVAKQGVGGKEEEELARAIQHEKRVNMHRRIVAELQIHLSLNQLSSEQVPGKMDGKTIATDSYRSEQKIKGLTKHCLVNSIQPDSL